MAGSNLLVSVPPWLATMRGLERGRQFSDQAGLTSEWIKRISELYPETTTYLERRAQDATPELSGLAAAYCMATNGIRPPFDADDESRSFLDPNAWKAFGVEAGPPRSGDVLVLNGRGHRIALYESETADGNYVGLGSDRVRIVDRSSCEAIRRPVPSNAGSQPAADPVALLQMLQKLLADRRPSTPAPRLSRIDELLGGETMAGLKTPLAIVAYAGLSILQAVGIVGPLTGPHATATAQVLTAVIAGFGALGLAAKLDRLTNAVAASAAAIERRPPPTAPMAPILPPSQPPYPVPAPAPVARNALNLPRPELTELLTLNRTLGPRTSQSQDKALADFLSRLGSTESPNEATKQVSLSPKRSLNAWISTASPRVGETFRVSINIGDGKDAVASVGIFEPDWGQATSMTLAVFVSCPNCKVEPSGQELILPRTGDTERIHFAITTMIAGNHEFNVRVYLAKQMIPLQSLRFVVKVMGEFNPAAAAQS
ncbi:hypothetical protein JQ607_35180 [Bradyrhizobium liaoningense]|uniref:hypothetical protein n=1 Tax=Bradyrhizobium liaoningense TaxID=43992 RepID=UPI001BADF043|nr:hypothetical protein [Bradyrhizobium liaoningense]MBR0845462.1 hypothetical protein [Bradyrhizobium liaoningense]